MQRKLEELCQIETSLLLEAVNINFLSRELQVGVNVNTVEAKTLIASVFLMKSQQHVLESCGFVFYFPFHCPTNYCCCMLSGTKVKSNN